MWQDLILRAPQWKMWVMTSPNEVCSFSFTGDINRANIDWKKETAALISTSPIIGILASTKCPITTKDSYKCGDCRDICFPMQKAHINRYLFAKKNQGFKMGEECRLCICGGGGVGCSAIAIQFFNRQYVDEYDPTIEDIFRGVVNWNRSPPFESLLKQQSPRCRAANTPKRLGFDLVAYEKSCDKTTLETIQILDTAGQEEYSAMRDQYMRSEQGFLLVYAITSRASFDEVTCFYDQVHRVKDDDHVPVVLVGNKSDLEEERQVPQVEGVELAIRLKCPFFEQIHYTARALTLPCVPYSFW
eukprot:TRINITY_DN4025_c0_g1_i1.p1 TRINITY_DN4025_c0_g1~~TRINITY_DN4025_c0_g1_i1.p1  ORF type:complete len:302 (+),score=23.22 TRINITY_DN4025_c0_g1_i1:72-977(+)